MVTGSSARADSRNAWSGGSSFGCTGKPAASAVANAGTTSAQAASALRRAGDRLAGDPREVTRVAVGDRDRNDFRSVIRMDFADRRLNLGIQHGARLDDNRNLFSRFDLAAPVINSLDW